MKDLNDEVGNEAARLLAQLTGGGKALSATVLRGNFNTAQPLEVVNFLFTNSISSYSTSSDSASLVWILALGSTSSEMISCLEVYFKTLNHVVRP